MSNLTFGLNDFRKVPYVSQVLSGGGATGAILEVINNEVANKMTSHIHLYKEQEEVEGEFMEDKNFTKEKPRN